MNNDKNIDESCLIEGISQGQKFAFEYLFNCYYKRLCLIAQKYVKDSQTAEGIVLVIFERLWEKREQIFISQSLSSYLFQSVHHECLNHLNSFSHRQKPTTSIYQHQEDCRDPDHHFLSQLYAIELEEKIREGINNLPDRCREIFLMSRYEDLSNIDIAEKLDLSLCTVKNQIAIALKKLKKVLKPR